MKAPPVIGRYAFSLQTMLWVAWTNWSGVTNRPISRLGTLVRARFDAFRRSGGHAQTSLGVAPGSAVSLGQTGTLRGSTFVQPRHGGLSFRLRQP